MDLNPNNSRTDNDALERTGNPEYQNEAGFTFSDINYENISSLEDLGGNSDRIKYFLEHGDLNLKSSLGTTLLHIAAEVGELQAVKGLIHRGADLTCVDNNGNTCLHRAALGGHLNTIENFLQHDNANVKNTFGRTPLHNAAEFGRLEAVKFLINNGANPKCVDSGGNTCLFRATIGGDLDTMKYFLQHNEVNAKNNLGRTPLHNAAEFGKLEAVKFLIDNGGNPRCLDIGGNTCLHRAALGGHIITIEYFLQRDDVNVKNILGRTPLHNAAEIGHFAAAEFLITKGGDLTGLDNGGNTCLHRAAIGGNIDLIKYFLEFTPGNTKNGLHRTPLHHAAEFGKLEAVKFLIDNGADVTCLDINGNTNLHRAAAGGHLNTIQYFLQNQDVNIRNSLGRAPLHNAAEFGKLEACEFLIRNNAELTCKDNNGNTYLHRAAIGGNVNTIEYFLQYSNVNVMNLLGRTPLHNAAEFGKVAAAKFLIDKGADLTILDNNGNTCTHRAAIGGHVDVIEYFLGQSKGGAKLNAANAGNPEYLNDCSSHRETNGGYLNKAQYSLQNGRTNSFVAQFLYYAVYYGKLGTIAILALLVMMAIVTFIHYLIF